MKNFKLNKEKLYVMILSGFILINTCSCGKNTLQLEENNGYIVENKVEQSQINDNSNNMVETKKEPEVTQDKQVVYSEEDNMIIEEFTSIKNKVTEYLNSKEAKDAKDKAKGVFISMVDFLFYDGEIKGIKFNDLTDEGKKRVLELATDVDSFIITKFPTYKEDIADVTKTAYIKASELIKKGANNIKEFSKEKLGEENYNAIIDAKDELVEYTKDAFEIVGNVSSNLWNGAKEKIKNWYEEFRDN